MVECRDCGQPIFWAKSGSERWMPLNPKPDPLGNIVFDEFDLVGPGEEIGTPDMTARFIRHFVTCGGPRK